MQNSESGISAEVYFALSDGVEVFFCAMLISKPMYHTSVRIATTQHLPKSHMTLYLPCDSGFIKLMHKCILLKTQGSCNFFLLNMCSGLMFGSVAASHCLYFCFLVCLTNGRGFKDKISNGRGFNSMISNGSGL